MTKAKNERRHIQNRAWEKDRRDRLNTTFENLAKLLPEYQPKANFSKIEIRLKTIQYIEDLRKKLRDVLSTQNASILKTQEELEESLKALVTQNNNLVELLEKANIKVPHFVGPKLLSFIITVHDSKATNESENGDKNKNIPNKPPIKSNSTKDIVKPAEVIQKTNSNGNEDKNESLDQSDEKSSPKSAGNILPELKEVQSFGSVDLISVSNSTKPELKVHEKPVKNYVEITPLLSTHKEDQPIQPPKSIEAEVKVSVNAQVPKTDSRPSNVSLILSNVQSSSNDVTSGRKQDVEVSQVAERDKRETKTAPKETVIVSHCEKKSAGKENEVQNRLKIVQTSTSTLNPLKNVVENAVVYNYNYCNNKNRSSSENTKSNVCHSNVHRNKQAQKNLNINKFLNDGKQRQSHDAEHDVSKLPLVDSKKLPISECLPTSIQSHSMISDRTSYIPSNTFENISTPAENTSDFYVSLSTLGLPMKSAATLPPINPINPPSAPINPSSHFNFQISSLAQPRSLIDSRPLIADAPFTFSLTKCTDTTTTTDSVLKNTSQQLDTQHRLNKTPKKSSPTKHLVNDRFVVPPDPTITPFNRCNSFNPFSFDNPPILPPASSMALSSLTTVSSTSSAISTPFTFTLTPTFPTITASTPLLSNHDPLFSSSFDMPILRPTPHPRM